jgi:hypothetical protein
MFDTKQNARSVRTRGIGASIKNPSPSPIGDL